MTWTHRDVGPICGNQSQIPDQPFYGAADFSWPSLAADPDSDLVGMVWSNRDKPSSAPHVSVSLDAGQTWSSPIALPHPLKAGLMPELAAAGGLLRLTYVAMMSSGQYDAIHRESADGITWSEPMVRNSTQSCNCWGGLNGPGIGAPRIGDYIGIEACARRVVAAWPDNRNPEQAQNIFARVATYA